MTIARKEWNKFKQRSESVQGVEASTFLVGTIISPVLNVMEMFLLVLLLQFIQFNLRMKHAVLLNKRAMAL